MSHTPGPWYLTSDRLVCATTPKGQAELASVENSSEYVSHLQREANARLIKAAPELLAACKAVLATLEGLDLEGRVLWIEPPHQAAAVHETVHERLMSVIAQAESAP